MFCGHPRVATFFKDNNMSYEDGDYVDYNLYYACELMEDSLVWLKKRASENPEPALVQLIRQIEDFIQ
jgi:hypothetical protein